MPPAKRKAAGGGTAGAGGKKAKKDTATAQPSTARQMVDALKKAGDDRRKTAKVDAYCHQLANNGSVRLSVIGPIPWGHSGPLCHALSLSSSLFVVVVDIDEQAACDSGSVRQ